METPPERRKQQQRRSKQHRARPSDRFELEYGGPPHPERSDDVANPIQDDVMEYGGSPQQEADVDGIPAPIKLTIGKWIKFHGPVAALIPVLTLLGVVMTAVCFLKAGVLEGIVIAALSIILTGALVFVEVRRRPSGRSPLN